MGGYAVCVCGPCAAFAAAFATMAELGSVALGAEASTEEGAEDDVPEGQRNNAPTAATTITTPMIAIGLIRLDEPLGRLGGGPCFMPLTRFPIVSLSDRDPVVMLRRHSNVFRPAAGVN